MDDDSCSKFIGSLTKYLQSLCHSYVEFDNGVELVGHIYLNVDTGKKIDYVLNESVCKNGANVVKFTSNSYHAQPVEKKDKKETPKKDSKSQSGKRGDDDDVIIVGSEGSRRNRTPGSSPSRSHALPNQMQRGMGMNRMSPGGMFRSPRGLSPRFGGPVPRPSGYTYQPRQRLTYPQSPRNILAGYSPRMRQPYQPRGAQPMPVRAPNATNPGNPVDTDVAFMREEYVSQPGQAATSTANQPGYQAPYQQGQQPLQAQQQQQGGQVQPAAGQQYGAPYTQANTATGQPTGMTVPMTTPAAVTGQPSGQPGETSQEGAMPTAATTDPSLFQQAQPAVSGGMPLPVTTHTIFDSGPVMTPLDIPNSQPAVGEGGSTPAAPAVADPLAAAMTSAGVTTDSNVSISTAASSMGLDAYQQNLLIGKVWSESNPAPDPSTGQAAPDQPVTSNAPFPTGDSTSTLPSLPTTDPLQPGTGFDIFNQQPVTQAGASQSSSSFSSTLSQANPLSQSSSSSGVDGDGFSALVSELQAFNQQAGAPAPPSQTLPTNQPTSTTTSTTSAGFPPSTTAPSAESSRDKPSYGVSRTGERVLIKRDPGVKRDPDISANIASSVLQESTEATTSQGPADSFLSPKDVSGAPGGMDARKHSGSTSQSTSQSLNTSTPGTGSLVGPESVVIETKPFLHQSSDYDCDSASTSAGDRLAGPQGQPPSQAGASHPTSQAQPDSSTSSAPSTSTSMTPPVNVKKEQKDEGEAEQETIKHAQSEWQNKNTESDWVTDMSALNNSDDSMESDSDTAQDDDDPNYTPGRPLGGVDKNARKRSPRKPHAGQKAPKSPAAKATAPETSQQHTRTPQKAAAAAQPPVPEDNVVNILDSDEEENQGSSGGYTLPPNVFIKKEKPDDVVVKKEPEDEYEDVSMPVVQSPKKKDPVAAGMKRKVWTDKEKDAVQMYFRTYLEEGTLPGKVEIEAVIAAEPSLQGRTWHNIKDYLRNAQLASSKRPLPKPAEKSSKSKRRKLDNPESEGGGEEQSGEMSDDDSDPPLPEQPPSLDSDQQMEQSYDDAVYKPGTFVLVNVTKDSDRSGRMRPTHTPAEPTPRTRQSSTERQKHYRACRGAERGKKGKCLPKERSKYKKVIVPPEGQTDSVWVHVLVSAGTGLWRLPSIDQMVDLRMDPADIIKPLEKSHVNIVGSKVFYKFDDILNFSTPKLTATHYRHRMKEENPTKYAEYLAKQRERNRQLRQGVRDKWENKPSTRAAIQQRERFLELRRAKRDTEKVKKSQSRSVRHHQARGSSSKPPKKRPKDVTPAENKERS